MTNWICARCDPPYRCCSAIYCKITLRLANERFGRFADWPEPAEGMLLINAAGCKIPPRYRIACSLHVCSETVERITSPNWQRAYNNLAYLIRCMWLNTAVERHASGDGGERIAHRRRIRHFPPLALFRRVTERAGQEMRRLARSGYDQDNRF